MIEMVSATHVVTQSGQVIHVKGNRLEVIRLLDIAWAKPRSLGVDLNVLVRPVPKDPYRLAQMWVGMGQVAKMSVLDDHKVEYDDTPLILADLSIPDVTPVEGELEAIL